MKSKWMDGFKISKPNLGKDIGLIPSTRSRKTNKPSLHGVKDSHKCQSPNQIRALNDLRDKF